MMAFGDVNMGKLMKNKFGIRSVASKSGGAGSAFDARLQSIKTKDEEDLTKKEKAMLSGKRVLKSKSKVSPNKLGFYGAKRPTTNLLVPNVELSSVLNMQTNLPVSEFMKSNSPTGIMSSKDVMGGVSEFAKKLKGVEGIKNVNLIKDAQGKVTGLDVSRDFMKTQLDFNPRTLSFTKKDWQTDIPKDYKYVNGKYVAPEKQYTSYYEKDKKDKKKRTATYNPVEIYVDDSGKIQKIINKSLMKSSYEQDNYDKEYRRKTYDRKVQEYYDDGTVKSIKEWQPYTEKYKSRERGSKDETEYSKKLFQTKDVSYNPKGIITGHKQWDVYRTEEDKISRYLSPVTKADVQAVARNPLLAGQYAQKAGAYATTTREKDEYYEKPFLSVEKTFDEYGRPVAVKQYDDYSTGMTDRGYRQMSERDVFLKQEDRYADGYKYGTAIFDDYLSDFRPSSRSARFIYETALKRELAYDPLTGKIINEVDYW